MIITVTDTGPGLTQEQQETLFNEGVQFNPNELQAGQGSGLGLWISKEIIALHQGEIHVSSKGLGTGTTFQIKLPVVYRDKIEPSHRGVRGSLRSIVTPQPQSRPPGTPSFREGLPTSHPPGSPQGTPSLGQEPDPQGTLSPPVVPLDPSRPLQILVVDDVLSNRKLVSRLLQSKGYSCQQAENGQVCVDRILSGDPNQFDLILMDYEMPVLNGPMAAKKLREMNCEILIIGLTGNILPEDQQFFIDHGANFVLPKPVNVDDLLECIRVHQQQNDSSDAAAAIIAAAPTVCGSHGAPFSSGIQASTPPLDAVATAGEIV
jgi:CheY-like chemotaxis protein